MQRTLRLTLQLLLGGWAFGQPPAQVDSMKQANRLRNVRYCEILVVHRHGFSGTADIYNTLGLNDCPEQQWRSLNVDALKNETRAYRIVLNGPRFFTMDRNALRDPGPERDFDGLRTHLVAQIEAKQGDEKRVPYTETFVTRQSCYVYESGKNVYQLHASSGRVYIMQSYSIEVDPNLDESSLSTLASRLALPNDWRYEVHKLRADFTVCNTGNRARVLQDDLKNTYQAVDSEVGHQVAK